MSLSEFGLMTAIVIADKEQNANYHLLFIFIFKYIDISESRSPAVSKFLLHRRTSNVYELKLVHLVNVTLLLIRVLLRKSTSNIQLIIRKEGSPLVCAIRMFPA